MALDIPAAGIGVAIVAALLLAEAGVVAKLTPAAHPIATNAIGMLAGTGLLVRISVVVGEEWRLPARTGTWVAAAYLVVMGSVVVFWLFIFVVRRWTASATSFQFLLIPLATVPFSAALTGEVITPLMLIGGTIVLGASISASSPHRCRAPPAPAERRRPRAAPAGSRPSGVSGC